MNDCNCNCPKPIVPNKDCGFNGSDKPGCSCGACGKPIKKCACPMPCGCPADNATRKHLIQAVLGDDKTGEYIPENGLFKNAIVEYEANGAVYIYDSLGVFTNIKEGNN